MSCGQRALMAHRLLAQQALDQFIRVANGVQDWELMNTRILSPSGYSL